VNLFGKEKASKVKVATFEPLIIIIEKNQSVFDAERFQVQPLFKK